MDSHLMEPLLVPNDHAPVATATPGEHGDSAADDKSNTVVDAATCTYDNSSTGMASALADAKANGDEDRDGVEGDEMSASVQGRLEESSAVEKEAKEEEEEEEEIGDDAEADDMAARMERRLAALPGKAHQSEPFTIFRVAGHMRDRNRHLFEPQMISIGPFHRGAGRHLVAMEAHKWRYLRNLLARTSGKAGGATLATYARAARAMESRARRRYSEPVAMPAAEFAEMLLLDGCFVLEFFLRFEDFADDALIDPTWAMQNVYKDLILMENQLPFFVLERFYDIATGGLGRDHFISEVLVHNLTVDMLPREAEAKRPPDGEIHHLLHLYYHWFLPPEDRSGSGKGEDDALEELTPIDERIQWQIPSASELKDAGVTFSSRKTPRSMVDVSFDRRSGVLAIPPVESYTNHAIFANMLAYEQSRGALERQRLVSYVILMSCVADSRRDVEIMQRAGVFVKGDEETAAFYAQLGELCPPPEIVDNCYDGLFRDVREYCGRSWNRHRAVLLQDYFSNPWTSMSAAAAVFLLILTVVQTVYTVLSYYNPQK